MQLVMKFVTRTNGLFVAGLILISILITGYQPAERERCISRSPAFEGDGPGYELLNLADGDVWATRSWTPEDYAEFSLPVSWAFWRKNDPRITLADRGQFLQSPGCDIGQYSYMKAFDKEFLQVVQLIAMNQPVDRQGLIRAVELEKYHVLHYAAGRTVSILQDPSGQQFIGVSQSLERSTVTPTLPEGWTLAEHQLTEDLQVDLLEQVTVLRLDNEDSFQGPLPQGISF